MQCKFLLVVLAAFWQIIVGFPHTVLASDVSEFQYHYNQNPGVDLSGMSRGPIAINDIANNLTIDSGLGQIAIAAQLKNALQQAMTKAKAPMAGTPGKSGMQISGEIETFAKDAEEKLLLKAHLILSRDGKTLWENSFVGKGTDKGELTAAVSKAIDQLIDELFYDDYFLNEVES